MNDYIGYQWLANHYSIHPVQKFRITSRIESRRSTVHDNGYTIESYPASSRPEDSLRGHLLFALKNEGVHLEFLSRLFASLPKAELEAWIKEEPTGQYARRACFFYEWLTGNALKIDSLPNVRYVDAIDPDHCFTAENAVNNSRFRIRNNLPGTRDFCPLIFRTDKVIQAENYDFEKTIQKLEEEFGSDLLMRSSVWLTIKESRASFAIEHEEDQNDRIKRFAHVMEHSCGIQEYPLKEDSLKKLQSDILGSNAMRLGIRQSPVFVGEMGHFGDIVHYIAPNAKDIQGMIEGLQFFQNATVGKSPLVRAAVLSFGFVYIHPMSDGNGRISRFLINDTLRRDKAIFAPLILPISATITHTPASRRHYDQILEIFSKPFMHSYQSKYHFTNEQIAPDGVRYNLIFDAYEDACHAWRYLDLTEHVVYLAEIVDITIAEEMRKEASYLRHLRQMRSQIKEIIDGPDGDIDRLIRSIRETGTISNKLQKEFPILATEEIAKKLISIVLKS